MAEGIIGSVGVAVVPDAEGFVARFNAQTRGMDEAGRKAGHEWQRGFDSATHGVNLRVNADTAGARTQLESIRRSADALGRTNPNIRVKADTAAATGQMHALRDAILLIGPAAVPLGAVAVGALAGIVPAAGAAILGVKGLINEMKSGRLAGTAFAGDIQTLQGEFHQLQTTAAGGLMPGISQAIQATQPAFATVNQDIAVMSTQIGTIVGGLGPALVAIFNQLNPLFTTFGQVLGDGAHKLESWAQNGTGIQSFVAYVQTELPQVEHDLGQLIVGVVHLAESLAPFGHLALSTIGVLADAFDAIPTGVLTLLASGALSAYAAFRTFQAVTHIVDSVSGAFTKFQASMSATFGSTSAASLAAQESALKEAAVVADAKATEARAAADAAAQIANSSLIVSDSLKAEAEAAAATADEFAAEMKVKADAAAAAAESIATSNAATAESGVGTGAASLGLAGMLGPLAAVGVGLTLLVGLFHSNNDAAQENQKIMNSYANTLQQNSNALASVNTNQTVKNLQDDKSIGLLNQLHDANVLLGTSQTALVFAVNKGGAAYDNLHAKLLQIAAANKDVGETAGKGGGYLTYNATGKAALALAKNIDQLRDSFTKEQRQELEAQRIARQTKQAEDGGASAAARQAGALHLGTQAYLDAQLAAKKSTDQTNAQTAAFQAEGDAASLLQQALDGLAGRNLSLAQSQTAVASANLGVLSSFKQNGAAIRGNGAAAVANQQAIQGQVQAAQQLALANDKGAHSQRDAIRSFEGAKHALEAQLAAHHKLTPAVQAYINKLYDLRDLNAYLKAHPTPVDANTAAGDRKIAAYQTEINAIKQGKIPGLTADTAHGQEVLRELQADIDAIRQHKKPPFDLNMTPAYDAAQRLQRYISNLQLQAHVHLVVPAGTAPRDYIPGQGPTVTNGSAAGSKSWTRDGKLPTGYSTVGERGWELVKTDTAGRSEVFSHAQSRAMTGGPSVLPGFASGTGGLSGNAKQIAEALRGLLGLSRAGIAGVLGNLKVESGFDPTAVGGPAHGIAQWQDGRFAALQSYAKAHNRRWTNLKIQEQFLAKELGGMPGLLDTLRHGGDAGGKAAAFDRIFERSDGRARGQRMSAAQNIDGLLGNTNLSGGGVSPLGKLQTQLKGVNKEAHIARAGINALGRDLSGTASKAATAYATVSAELNKMGASKKQVEALHSLNLKLDREISTRNATNANIAALVAKEKDLAAQVKSAFSGGFDITSAGTGPSGSGGVSYGSIYAQAEQTQLRSSQLDAGIRRLARLGLNKTEQLQLANAGVSALPQVSALTHASRGQIAALNSAYASISTHGQNLGNYLGQNVYGADIAKDIRVRNHENAAIRKEYQSLLKEVRHLVDALQHDQHRAIVLKMNNREVARANRAGQRRANR